MLYIGVNITSSGDALRKITIDHIYHALRNPKPDIASRIKQLRIIKELNVKDYSVLKKQLPYLVCGCFNPPYRRTENFAYIEYFFVDIDHLSQKEMDLDAVRSKIEADERVLLCFTSPGEDGLKVLFRLKERCYDAGLYALFYKAFVHRFSKDYQLEQVVDTRTCDVSRACFVSIDSCAFYRPDALAIEVNLYIDTSNPAELFALKNKFKKEEKENIQNVVEVPKQTDPEDAILLNIKQLLNPKAAAKQKEKSSIYVPQQLNDIMDDLKKYIENTGVVMYEVQSIHYGKKMRFKVGGRLAEINLFYGKRGFSVVQSPRCGTCGEMNEMMAQLIHVYLSEQALW